MREEMSNNYNKHEKKEELSTKDYLILKMREFFCRVDKNKIVSIQTINKRSNNESS